MATDSHTTTMKPAPGALRLVQAFINTRDLESGEDELADVEGLRTWLKRHDLVEEGEGIDEADLRRALEAREGLRALTLANGGEPLEESVIDSLNRIADRGRLVLRFTEDGQSMLTPAVGGADAALARILAVVTTAMSEGTWARLKACSTDTCQWAFYDHSKNRAGKWCTMDVCGNRAKAQAYRERRRGGRQS